MKVYEEEQVQLHTFLTSVLTGECAASLARLFSRRS